MITTYRTAELRDDLKIRESKRKPRKTPPPLDSSRQALVVGFIQDTRRLACAFHRRHAPDVPSDEIIAEAAAGLAYAAALFDPARGVPFAGYAKLVIHHKMMHAAACWRRWRKAGPWPTDDDGQDMDAPAAPESDPCAQIDAAEQMARVRGALPARSYKVLRLRFTDELTLQRIGQRLGVGPERARQLEADAIEQARRELCQA